MTPNPLDIVRQILARQPKPPAPRAAPGDWTQAAEAVHTLVTSHGWGVTPAVRMVIGQLDPPDHDRAFNGIRAGYYAIRRNLQHRAKP